MAYRSTPHTTTGKSPAELIYGRNIGTKLPDIGEMGEIDHCSVQQKQVKDHDAEQKQIASSAYLCVVISLKFFYVCSIRSDSGGRQNSNIHVLRDYFLLKWGVFMGCHIRLNYINTVLLNFL